MTETLSAYEKSNETSLVDTFHQVGSLIPKGQNLTTIPKDKTVGEALEMMRLQSYSQLPVVAGNEVLGVFSYRSFSLNAAEIQRQRRNEVLADLPVSEFMEDFQRISPSEDWTKIQRYLGENDGVLIDRADSLPGLVTTMDVYHYFRNIADPFILIAEIEVTLRRLIADKIPKEDRPSVFQRLLVGAYGENKTSYHLNDLTLKDYVTIVTSKVTWHYFQDVLGPNERDRNTTNDKLANVPELRNAVFHFKRPLRRQELRQLTEGRKWLHLNIRAYEGKRKLTLQQQATNQLAIPKPMNPKYERLAAEFTPAAAEFYPWLIATAGMQAQDYAIQYHAKSFSIRLRTAEGLKGFAYGYYPERFEVYFAHLGMSPAALGDLRRALLGYGVFAEAGKHSFIAHVSQVDGNRLREACRYLLNTLSDSSNSNSV